MSERGQGISLPGAPAQTPGLPENLHPQAFEIFNGIDTKTPRPGIQDQFCSWMDGFMPIGPNNARILPGTGPVINTNVGTGFTYFWIGFGNIGDVSYCYALLNDGRVVQINPVTLVVTLVMVGGTIQVPSSVLGFSQWGSQYIIFAKDQTNGYWLWDGTNLFTAGTIGPVVEIDADGMGYSSSPSITVQTTGSGSGIAITFQIENGMVTKGTVTNPGTGFTVGDFVSVAVSGGGSDNQAWVNPVVAGGGTGGGLDEVFVLDGGTGYSGYTFATVSGGGGSGASVSLGIQNGVITMAAVVNSGINYTSTPTITITDPGVPGGGAPIGTGGVVQANITFGQIQGLTLGSGGSGYTSPPIVKITGDGTGATAVATIAGGAVTGLTMTAYGKGYSNAVISLTGGNNAANVSLQLMPFGVSGTWVEIYENHVWVGNGGAVADFPPRSRVIFSAPDSPVDFGDGGGAFLSNDSFLKVGYHGGKQANGFLYLVGDSSMNYISGVQTTTPSSSSTTPIPTTTFGNLNVDPQIGSPWPSSIQVFSRNIMLANTVGIYVSYGGAVRKASDPLDGFYPFGPIYGSTANFSSAVAHIFGIPVYMLLLPVVNDPVYGSVNKLLMWDGKRWFTSEQDRNLAYIATQEINSVLTAWATDGNSVFQLFAQPTTSGEFTKTIQSKLYSSPMYASTKQARSLSGILNFNTSDSPVTITIDNEGGEGTANAEVTITPASSHVTIVANGQTTTYTPPGWTGTGLVVFGPVPIGQQGRLIGLTMQTTASDVSLLSLFLADMIESPNI